LWGLGFIAGTFKMTEMFQKFNGKLDRWELLERKNNKFIKIDVFKQNPRVPFRGIPIRFSKRGGILQK
jgi:hypothetical protein